MPTHLYRSSVTAMGLVSQQVSLSVIPAVVENRASAFNTCNRKITLERWERYWDWRGGSSGNNSYKHFLRLKICRSEFQWTAVLPISPIVWYVTKLSRNVPWKIGSNGSLLQVAWSPAYNRADCKAIQLRSVHFDKVSLRSLCCANYSPRLNLYNSG